LDRQRDKLVAALAGLDADVVGLIEIENPRTGEPDHALDDLVAGLNAELGAGTYAAIETGTLGGDAIKLAIIYKPEKVTPVGQTAFIDSGAFAHRNRVPLAQAFEANGDRFVVVVNHLKSKGSPCADGSVNDPDDVFPDDPDLGDGQANCNLTRLIAANALIDWLATDPTQAGTTHVLVTGDLNAYAMEDPIRAFKDAGYLNLLEMLGTDEYSFVFDGQWGALDYALASPSIAAKVVSAIEWHINADEPPVLDYTMSFKSPNQHDILYSPDAYRSSDHDPIVLGLNMIAPEGAFSSTAYQVLEGVGEATITVTLNTPLGVTVTVTYETEDGTAVAGVDYVAASGSLVFSPGTTSSAFSVAILDNDESQPDRVLSLKLTAFGEMRSANLTILDDDPPLAGFASNSPVRVGSLSVFTNTTTGFGTISYEWNFGDGSPPVTEANPGHLYATAGNYTVILTATNAFGNSVATAVFEVHPYQLFLPIVSRDSAPAASGRVEIFFAPTVAWQANRR
jgi:hypothetical protein